jgi:hypothetical protein
MVSGVLKKEINVILDLQNLEMPLISLLVSYKKSRNLLVELVVKKLQFPSLLMENLHKKQLKCLILILLIVVKL